MNAENELLKVHKKQQLEYFGYIIREGNMEEVLTAGRIEGTRDRGRHRRKQLDNMFTTGQEL